MTTSVEDITGEPPLIAKSSQHVVIIKAYKRRWWILFLYALLSAVQNCFWLTYNTSTHDRSYFPHFSPIFIRFHAVCGPKTDFSCNS